MMRRPRTPHFIAGLGDGNVMRQNNNNNNNKNNKNNNADDFVFRRPPPFMTGHVRKRPSPQSPIIMMETTTTHNTGSGSGDYANDASGDPLLSEAGAWQISAIALLGIMGLLVALFLHLVTDGPVMLEQNKSRGGTTASSIRRRFSKQKKKTDEWSEDEQDSDYNDGNRADTESTSAHHAPHQHQVDQQQGQQGGALLYYPYQPRYPQQQHRHRKPSGSGYTELSSKNAADYSPLNSRPYYHHNMSGSAPTPVYTAPSSSHRRQQQQQQQQHQSPVPPVKPVAAAVARKLQQQQQHVQDDIGHGLEGFQHHAQQQQQQQEDYEGGGGGGIPIPPRRPLSPISSFESIGANDSATESSSSPFLSPVRKRKDKMMAVSRGLGVTTTTDDDDEKASSGEASSLLLSPGTEDFVTPRVDNAYKKKRFRQQGGIETAVTLSGSDGGVAARLPFIPNLEEELVSSETHSQPPLSDDSRSEQAPSSQELSEEELHLVRMETGELPPAWASAPTADKKKTKKVTPEKKPKQAYPGHANPKKSPQDKQSSSTPTPQKNNPRNSIIHKRKNLTHSTDAGSSLLSSIDFEELKLIEVIGGGGFGQVWKATWRGTPVAVKVLTGTVQTEFVSKSLLEEFAAEINMLKGMRHPNVCLYMGACLEPPNRAIITELAGNGSLWDALRLPLMAPYIAADGVSRDAWPLELYHSGSQPPPLPPPPGTWPWCLVKRVACGAARGMTYLHSGHPPVLHRDLKSANLLLDDSYTAKVCDFGLSRLKAQERSMTGNCGTVQWMAPEVLANKRYAEPADVYSFGIILWELLMRECPYEGMSAIQCALAVLNRNHRPAIPDWCPPALAALIEACLEKDPSKRPTFAQMILALDAMP